MCQYIEEQGPVYLDYNATTPMVPSVTTAIVNSLGLWGNPSSNNIFGKSANIAIESARESLAKLVNVNCDEIVFTSGGTEANNWIINSCIKGYCLAAGNSEKPHVVTTNIEHPSIHEPLKSAERYGVCDVSYIPVNVSTGAVEVDCIVRALTSRTCLVTVMLANNETGVIQPIKEIASGVKHKAKDHNWHIVVHTDAAQAIGKIDVDVQLLDVDFLTIVGHKFYGPRIGALAIRKSGFTDSQPLIPMFYGGNQEDGLRPGSENTPMIVGLGAAASFVCQNIAKLQNDLTSIRDYFDLKLLENLGGKVKINFKNCLNRLPNTSNVTFMDREDTAAELLSKCKSFIASTGSACHSSLTRPSQVLLASGLSEKEALRSVRFSFGKDTTVSDVDRVICELKAITFLSKYASSLIKTLGVGSQSAVR